MSSQPGRLGIVVHAARKAVDFWNVAHCHVDHGLARVIVLRPSELSSVLARALMIVRPVAAGEAFGPLQALVSRIEMVLSDLEEEASEGLSLLRRLRERGRVVASAAHAANSARRLGRRPIPPAERPVAQVPATLGREHAMRPIAA